MWLFFFLSFSLSLSLSLSSIMSKSNNAVNSIVSDLMRAAAGAGARNVSDEDIDKYVADLILKEAEEKRKKYQEVGIQAYQPVT